MPTWVVKVDGRDAEFAAEVMADGGASRYRKTTAVWAFRLAQSVSINTPEGTMEAHAGDYLVSDDPPTHLWPVRREVFERTYEPEDG